MVFKSIKKMFGIGAPPARQKPVAPAPVAPFPKELAYSYIPEGAVVIEAGAHIGVHTAEMARLRNCRIHAFEPVPHIFAQLRENTRPFANVTCYNLALSDRTGFADMFVSSGGSDGSSSLLTPKEHLNTNPDVLFEEKIRVETSTLDDWAARQGIARVDYMWLDMQGAEYAMLQASPNLLKTVRVIFTEVSLMELYEGTPLYPEFKRWLQGQGFVLEKEVLPWDSCGDALFVRK